MHIRHSVLMIVWLFGCLLAVSPLAAVEVPSDVQVVKGKADDFILSKNDTLPQRLHASVQFSKAPDRSPNLVVLTFGAPATGDAAQGDAYRVSILRSSAVHDGKWLRFFTQKYNPQTKRWENNGDPRDLSFAPTQKAALRDLEADGVSPSSWHDQWIDLRVDMSHDNATLWAQGILVANINWTHNQNIKNTMLPVVLALSTDDAIKAISQSSWQADERFLQLNLDEKFNDEAPSEIAFEKSPVPFAVTQHQRKYLNLIQAQWIDGKRDPQSFYEFYDGGPVTLHDPRMVMLNVPKADYLAMHLLAVCDTDEALTDQLTVRAGRYGYMRQVMRRDFVTCVPRGELTQGMVHVRLPLDQAFAQDVLDNIIDMELTKEVKLARHVPDPNRFRYRPLGLPSGVRIAAITLERSPLQMTVTSTESANAFVEPQQPRFVVELKNITSKSQAYTLNVASNQREKTSGVLVKQGSVETGQIVREIFDLKDVPRGFNDLEVTLKLSDDQPALIRRTSFALLRPDDRKHRDDSPFGTWEWKGLHVTSTDSDAIGSLFKKLGFRYGMSNHPVEVRNKWGLLVSTEPKLEPELKQFDKMYAKDPTMPLRALIFHEDSISGAQVTRVPDIFHDRPAYVLNEQEEARYQKMLVQAIGGAKAARAKYPGVEISLGNGPLPTKEAFYRRGFPSELFDAGGNEAGSFHRMPETQPPDTIANNASIWMDRKLLDAYGYGDKPVRQCFEVGYPNDNPGNHSAVTQANYFVRNALHSLAWGMPFIHVGEITDVGNSYYFSNWGAAGFCKAYPEMEVKPAFVAMATLTSVMDGATFVRVHDLGSPSLYVLEFLRADGQTVLAMWTMRGQRAVTVEGTSNKSWRLWNDQGVESQVPVKIMLSASPVYVVGKGKLGAISTGEPVYDDVQPADASVVMAMGDLSGWTNVASRNAELETYNPLEPRTMGQFKFDVVKDFEGDETAVCVTPMQPFGGKDTMPMYSVLVHDKGIVLPGKADEIGIHVNGNSGWGRVIYELTDAKGERWISLGAAANEEPAPWLTDWMPREMQGQMTGEKLQASDWSTDDAYGISRINFDGWRYVGFPLPGNYEGEHHPWPANSNWRWDADGIVDYPLTLKKLVIELPQKVLHVQSWAPAPRAEIYLKKLVVGTSVKQ